jgi:hypothetical protein
MKLHQTLFKILALIAVIAILSGCSASPAATTPTTAPTQNLQPTFDQIGTQAAQTIIANLTLSAPTITPTVPTSTSSPTGTPTLTFTPLPPTLTPSRTYIPWTSTPIYSATPVGYACSITSAAPASTVTLKKGSDFDGKWVVKNTGTQTWSKANADIKYISGTKFQTKGDLFDLQSDVASGDSYTVTIDMLAPATAGAYQASWAIVQGSLSICALEVAITVVD